MVYFYIFWKVKKTVSIFSIMYFLNYAIHVNNPYFSFLWFPKHPHLSFLIYFSIFLLSLFIFLGFFCGVLFVSFFVSLFDLFASQENVTGGSLNCKRRLTWSLFSLSQLNNNPTVPSGVNHLSRRQSIPNSCSVSLNLSGVCLKLPRPKKEGQKFIKTYRLCQTLQCFMCRASLGIWPFFHWQKFPSMEGKYHFLTPTPAAPQCFCQFRYIKTIFSSQYFLCLSHITGFARES